MGLMTEAAVERTIDRDFDQTAVHLHGFGGKADCPTCFPSVDPSDFADLGARVDEGNAEPNVVCPICKSANCGGDDDLPFTGNNHLYVECPSCSQWHHRDFVHKCGEDADAGPRHVSPAILEFRIQQLEEANATLDKEKGIVAELYRQACLDRDIAKNRVIQFERFTRVMADHLDALRSVTPQPRAEFPKAA